MTSDAVDDQMPLIGIPSFIKPAGPSARPRTHYFMSVCPVSSEAGSQAAAADGDADEGETGAVEGAPSHLSTTLTRRAPSVSTHGTELACVVKPSGLLLGTEAPDMTPFGTEAFVITPSLVLVGDCPVCMLDPLPFVSL